MALSDEDLLMFAAGRQSPGQQSQPTQDDAGIMSFIGQPSARTPLTEEQKKGFKLAAEDEAMKAQAWKRKSESNLPYVQTVMEKVGSSLLSPAARLVGKTDLADRLVRSAAISEQVQRERESGGLIPDVVKATSRGALESLLLALPMGRIAKAPGIIGMFGVQEGNRAVTEGKDAGLKGIDLTAHVVKMGGYEALIALIAGRLGYGGFETAAAGRRATVSGLKEGFKQLGKDVSAEAVEELATAALQAREGVTSGVSPEALTPANIKQTIIETLLTSTMASGAVNLPGLVAAGKKGKVDKERGRVTDARAELVKSAESGVPMSRGDWKKLGLPPGKGRSKAERLEAARGAAAEIKAEAQAIAGYQEAGRPMIAADTPPEVPQVPQEAVQEAPAIQPDIQAIQAPVAVDQAEEGTGTSFGDMVAASPPPQAVTQQELTEQVPVVEQPIGEAKALFQGESGNIAVPVDTIAKAWRGTKTLLKRGFATGGLLPAPVQTAKLKKEGQKASLSRQLSDVTSDYKAAAKETYGTRNPSAENAEAIREVLNGRADVSVLPESMQEPVAAMRSGLDAASRELIRIGAVQGELAAIVGRNTGVYLTRTFKAFTDPKWPSKVPEGVLNRAVALIRSEHPELSKNEVDGRIAEILYEGKAAQTPLNLIRRASLGSKDLGILKKKNLEIPEEILDLLGEHTDPLVNYTQSMAKIGSMIANHKFLVEVREAGLVGGFFSERPTINEFGEMKTQIAEKGTESMEPLSGLYTTPEIADAFMRATDPKAIGPVLRVYYRLNASVKTAKTVFSPQAIVRNFIANPLIAFWNGHISFTGDYLGQGKDFWKAMQVTGKDVTPDWAKRLSNMVLPQFVNNLLAMDIKEFRSHMNRAAEVGLIGHDVIIGELRATMKDAGLFGPDADIAGVAAQRRGKTVTTLKASRKLAVDIYQAGDSVWKLFGWSREMKSYRKAYPDMPQAELEQMTADIVTDSYPTYSKTSAFVGLMRKNILTGSFVSFPAEIIRTKYKTMMLTRKEMTSDNLEIRKIGARRLTGMLSAASVSIGLPVISRMIAGISADDEDDMRKFMPEWQKNSHVIHLPKSEAGNNRYIDGSYSDPHSLFVKPFMAFFRNAGEGDIKKAFEESFREFLDPFVSEEILAKALSEVWRNSKGTHRLNVYNEEETVFQKGLSIGQHVGRAFLYGGAVSAERIGRGVAGKIERSGKVRDPVIEALSVVTGQRIEEQDIRQAMYYITGSFRGRLRSANSIFLDVVKNRGSVSDSSIDTAYKRSDAARRIVFEEMSETTQAAIRLGVPIGEVAAIIKGRGVSEATVRSIMSGRYFQYRPTVKLDAQRTRAWVGASQELRRAQ